MRKLKENTDSVSKDMLFYNLDMVFFIHILSNYIYLYLSIYYIFIFYIRKFFYTVNNNNHNHQKKYYIRVYFSKICRYIGRITFHILKLQHFSPNCFSILSVMVFDFFVTNRSKYHA